MQIPSNPKISEDIMEKFIKSGKPPAKAPTGQKTVKMYNVPFPPEVHRQAKINALNEGISLADYIIRAVVEANGRYDARE